MHYFAMLLTSYQKEKQANIKLNEQCGKNWKTIKYNKNVHVVYKNSTPVLPYGILEEKVAMQLHVKPHIKLKYFAQCNSSFKMLTIIGWGEFGKDRKHDELEDCVLKSFSLMPVFW